MAVEIIMPKVGVDMTEGEIVKWNKKVGEEVKKDDILLEILTDKVNMEIEAEEDGYLLAILHEAGEKVPVTEVIAYVGQKGEEVPGASAASASSEAKEAPKKPKAANEFDVIVIGGGPAGYVAAIRASQLGGKVLLFEEEALGGCCLNRGCIPTKTYLHNVEILEGIELAKTRGIHLGDASFSIDMSEVHALKQKVVGHLTGGVGALLKSNEVKVLAQKAKLGEGKSVIAEDGKEYKATSIILANGSIPARPPLPGADSPRVITSREILDWKSLPKSLAILGGGVIGVEFGQIFASFGVKVSLFEGGPRLLSKMDKDISEGLGKILKKKGLELHFNTKVASIEDTGNSVILKLEGGESLEADYLLLATGRKPNLEGLEEAGIKTEKGRVVVDDFLETSVPGIFAAGDLTGKKMLAHAAFRMGEVAAENAMEGKHRLLDLHSCPAAVYTLPEIGSLGMTEEEAKKAYGEVKVGRFPFAANGRALASSAGDGFAKVIIDGRYGEILGVHILGPTAAESINTAASLMEVEATIEEVLACIPGHPCYTEVVFEAFADSLGRSVHTMKK